MRAVTSEEGEGPWSDIGDGMANRPPNTNTLFLVDYSSAWGRYYVVPLPKFFEDADSDSLAYSTSSTNQGLVNVWMSGSALNFKMLNPGTATITYGAHDPYGGYVSRTVIYTTTGNVARSVPENSSAGTSVGAPVSGHPYPSDAVYTYTLSGDAVDSGAFVIDAATGQISVKQGATLDYETKSSYTGKVEWTVLGEASVANVTITVTDLEAGKPDTPLVTRTASAVAMNPALDVAWTAPAANGTTITSYEAQYRVKVADGEEANAWTDYTIDDGNDGQTKTLPATTTSINLPDLTAGTTYEAQVRAVTSDEGEGPWSDIGDGMANRPPNRILVQDTYHEMSPGKYGRGKVWSNAVDAGGFTDPDGDTLTYETASDNGAVARGEIRTTDGKREFRTVLRHPVTKYVAITLTVNDGYGGTNFLKVHLKGTRNETWSVNENSNARTVVGRLFSRTASNPQADANSLSLSGFPAGLLTIDADRTGQVRVANGATLDYETTSSYTGKILYTAGGVDAVVNITINVTDLEAGKPGTPTVARTAFSEPTNPALDATWTAAAANGTTITGYEAQYRVKVADGETANAWTLYEYEDPDNAGSQISLLAATATTVNLPDLDAGATYQVQVRAVTSDEGEGPWSDIGEGTANTPPTTAGTDLADATIALATATDYLINDKFTDADSDTLTYSASSAHTGVVTAAITGNDSDILTATAVNPAASVITYGVSDGYGGYASRSVTITGQSSVTRSVAENSAAGTAVGAPVTGAPYDDGDDQTDDALTYTLTGDATNAFVIDSSTGQISVKTGATLDRETTSSYTGAVEYTVQGQAATVAVTIEVTDLAAPPAPAAPAVSHATSDPTTILSVTWTAPDTSATLPVTDYDVQFRLKTDASWTDHDFTGTGTSTELTALTKDSAYQVRVRASNVEGTGGWSSLGEGATQPENTQPKFSKLTAAREVSENAPAGTAVGDPVTAMDMEGHILSYSLKSPSSLFNVDPATGQLTVATGASLDYETKSVYTIVVTASDGLSLVGLVDHIVDAENTVTIRLADVDEPPPAPAAPSVVRSATSPGSALNVSWTAPDVTGKPALTGYAISYKVASESQWTQLAHSGLQTRTTLTGLRTATAYDVSIRAINDEGASPWSDAGRGATAGATLPTLPPPTPPSPPPAEPTPEPTTTPTPEPTTTPTPEPTTTPTPEPTTTPTPEPTTTPTPEPTTTPTPEPTTTPTPEPTTTPTPEPTTTPTPEPTTTPTPEPTATPTPEPTTTPTPEAPAPTATPEASAPAATAEATATSTPTAPAPVPTPTPQAPAFHLMPAPIREIILDSQSSEFQPPAAPPPAPEFAYRRAIVFTAMRKLVATLPNPIAIPALAVTSLEVFYADRVQVGPPQAPPKKARAPP